MNLVVDIGNTRSKAALFDKGVLQRKEVFESLTALEQFLRSTPAEHLIISSVSANAEDVSRWSIASGRKITFTMDLTFPLKNKYASSATLGADRLAAACGAWLLFPSQPCLVIDIGTCINYEFVNMDGEYLGGAISPGLNMRFEAMHRDTSKLPVATPAETVPLIGDTTLRCLQSGVMNGALEEIKGTVARYRNDYPGTRVILCGGDAQFFENHLKPSIFVAPDLVLMGLNSILLQNVTS